MNKSLRIIMTFAFAASVFVGGVYAGGGSLETIGVENRAIAAPLVASSTIAQADFTEFWQVWQLMDEKFVYASSSKPVSADERMRGAIQGMVASFGDDYSVYFPPKESADFQQEMSGSFSGVGMEVGLRDGVITVVSPIDGTPAKRAGIMSGDRVLKIDGTDTKGMTVDEAVRRIRGERGTDVVLTILRDSEGKERTVSVTRDTITVPTVKTAEKGNAFVITLYTFNELAERKFAEALQQYVQSGKQYLVIDLRGNPGGYMNTAINIAGYFVRGGDVVLRERVGNGDTQETLYRSSGHTLGARAPKKIVVLMDNGSASASEILAGALRDNGVATLIGETSFGKGTVQEVVNLPSGASLKVTIARWFTPGGVNITHAGLAPDIEVKRTADDIKADRDPQLDAALDFFTR